MVFLFKVNTEKMFHNKYLMNIKIYFTMCINNFY